jgi:cation transport regulator ChaC
VTGKVKTLSPEINVATSSLVQTGLHETHPGEEPSPNMTHDKQTLTYFAYGSNMLTSQLAERTGDCTCRGLATLVGHELRFHKLGKDGSAKADAYRTGRQADAVIGVVFEVLRSRKPRLDRAEGLGKGYNEKTVLVRLRDGEEIEAVTYVAHPDAINVHLKPTPAYRKRVLDGASEHRLPAGYVQRFIASVATQEALSPNRRPVKPKGNSR